MNQYHKLYTPQDSAVVFIDHQPQMLFGLANLDRASLINSGGTGHWPVPSGDPPDGRN